MGKRKGRLGWVLGKEDCVNIGVWVARCVGVVYLWVYVGGIDVPGGVCIKPEDINDVGIA